MSVVSMPRREMWMNSSCYVNGCTERTLNNSLIGHLPFGLVNNHYCIRQRVKVKPRLAGLEKVKIWDYEKKKK